VNRWFRVAEPCAWIFARAPRTSRRVSRPPPERIRLDALEALRRVHPLPLHGDTIIKDLNVRSGGGSGGRNLHGDDRFGRSGKSARGYWIAVPFAAAWILSAMSWLGICTDGCEETHLYTLFGLPLSPLGVGYFTLCGIAFLTRNRFRFSGFLIPLLLAGALGSEFVLVWIQKYVIGKWCPLCVGIAFSVVAACVLIALERLPGIAIRIRGGERNLVMKRLAGKTALILSRSSPAWA